MLYVIGDLKGEEVFGMFFKKELQKNKSKKGLELKR